MELHRAGYSNALSLQCQPSTCQVQYLERLRAFSAVEATDFLGIYDALLLNKAVTFTIRLLIKDDVLSGRVKQVASELVAVVDDLSKARVRQDALACHRLYESLDDFNIAVNAWRNRICLSHCAFLYRRYRALLCSARNAARN